MSSQNDGFVVLFGSAAAGALHPRDLDLVVGGRYSAADAQALASEWWRSHAARYAVCAEPPCEVHRQQLAHPTGLHAYLLRPRGAETKAIVLAGEVCVEWYDVDSLPAAIRMAADGHDDAAREICSRIRNSTSGRIPVSMLEYDAGKPVGCGGYVGDGPVALEQALSRTGDRPFDLGGLLPSIADLGLPELLTTIRDNPGVWSGKRWRKGHEPALLAGLRNHWRGGTPMGCQGWAGTDDVVFNYAPPLSLSLIREIVTICGEVR